MNSGPGAHWEYSERVVPGKRYGTIPATGTGPLVIGVTHNGADIARVTERLTPKYAHQWTAS